LRFNSILENKLSAKMACDSRRSKHYDMEKEKQISVRAG
jgi:hypothetical protein